MITAERIIKLYNMKLLPGEGGYYKEIYRSPETIAASSLPERYGADRSYSTSILYLLTPEQVSNFHRLKSDGLARAVGRSAQDRRSPTRARAGSRVNADTVDCFIIIS